jgi:transcriptional regulator with XRE-family HTH domain
MSIQEKIGIRIKDLRKTHKLSQWDLSHRSDVDRSFIAGVEAGKRNISIAKLMQIIEVFSMTIREFFDNKIFDDHPPSTE